MSFKRNVRIGSERENNLLAFPRRLHQFLPEEFRRVDLHDYLAVEVGPGTVAEIFVSRTTETIGATVNASALTVQRVIETDIWTVVVTDVASRVCLFEDFQPGFRWFTQPLH